MPLRQSHAHLMWLSKQGKRQVHACIAEVFTSGPAKSGQACRPSPAGCLRRETPAGLHWLYQHPCIALMMSGLMCDEPDGTSQ